MLEQKVGQSPQEKPPVQLEEVDKVETKKLPKKLLKPVKNWDEIKHVLRELLELNYSQRLQDLRAEMDTYSKELPRVDINSLVWKAIAAVHPNRNLINKVKLRYFNAQRNLELTEELTKELKEEYQDNANLVEEIEQYGGGRSSSHSTYPQKFDFDSESPQCITYSVNDYILDFLPFSSFTLSHIQNPTGHHTAVLHLGSVYDEESSKNPELWQMMQALEIRAVPQETELIWSFPYSDEEQDENSVFETALHILKSVGDSSLEYVPTTANLKRYAYSHHQQNNPFTYLYKDFPGLSVLAKFGMGVVTFTVKVSDFPYPDSVLLPDRNNIFKERSVLNGSVDELTGKLAAALEEALSERKASKLK